MESVNKGLKGHTEHQAHPFIFYFFLNHISNIYIYIFNGKTQLVAWIDSVSDSIQL